jgi:tetratricopeptide (TPR) repeat protein
MEIDEYLDLFCGNMELVLELASSQFPEPLETAEFSDTLGRYLFERFERTGIIDDVDQAIAFEERAIQLTPNEDPERLPRLITLGNALLRRYERTGSMDDMNHAIEDNFEQAVELTPAGHPDLARRLNNLGNALLSRFERTGLMDDLDHAIDCYEEAATSDTAPPSERVVAARVCSYLLNNQSYDRTLRILRMAVDLLPKLSPRQLRGSDARYNISSVVRNITSRAVSLDLELGAGGPSESLQWLERGRGILANLQLEVRSDISALSDKHPELAQQFQELRDQIDAPSRTLETLASENSFVGLDSTSPDSYKVISERQKRFDNLLSDIRSLEGFENFLQGPSDTELRSLARDGAIVAFNVSDIRSDAFLVTPDFIRSVHLPLVTSGFVDDSIEHFFEAIDHDESYRHATRKLWDYMVNPVLDALGHTEAPPAGKTWPRVWWIPTGALSLLPIHAAGYHTSNSQRTVLDRVISSYAPTLKSLLYAQERAAKADRVKTNDKAILFAMPTTQEDPQMALSSVKTEVEDIQRLFSQTSSSVTVLTDPTRANALSELRRHTIAHFACHGYFAFDPSKSSLLLKDAHLTVSDLISLNIDAAKFAYLSACHTSTMRDFSLLDESITLTSAIQLCGYPSVVGSLWQVVDSHSAEVARDTYAWILKGESAKFDARRSAEGLHRAVRDLRERTRVGKKHDPLTWAPFIHVGI